jgi:hypothetical protein
MQKITKQKIGNNTIWVGLLLGLLLIIAPCSVQNILQNDFSVKITKTLNRSKFKIQINSNYCVYYDLSKLIKEKQLKKHSKLESSKVAVSQFSSISNSNASVFPLLTFGKLNKNDIPLYILYKNLKYSIPFYKTYSVVSNLSYRISFIPQN